MPRRAWGLVHGTLSSQISGAVHLEEVGCREFQKTALLILPSKFYRCGMWVRRALGVGRPAGVGGSPGGS